MMCIIEPGGTQNIIIKIHAKQIMTPQGIELSTVAQ
jgi:hypothetical protein